MVAKINFPFWAIPSKDALRRKEEREGGDTHTHAHTHTCTHTCTHTRTATHADTHMDDTQVRELSQCRSYGLALSGSFFEECTFEWLCWHSPCSCVCPCLCLRYFFFFCFFCFFWSLPAWPASLWEEEAASSPVSGDDDESDSEDSVEDSPNSRGL